MKLTPEQIRDMFMNAEPLHFMYRPKRWDERTLLEKILFFITYKTRDLEEDTALAASRTLDDIYGGGKDPVTRRRLKVCENCGEVEATHTNGRIEVCKDCAEFCIYSLAPCTCHVNPPCSSCERGHFVEIE